MAQNVHITVTVPVRRVNKTIRIEQNKNTLQIDYSLQIKLF